MSIVQHVHVQQQQLSYVVNRTLAASGYQVRSATASWRLAIGNEPRGDPAEAAAATEL